MPAVIYIFSLCTFTFGLSEFVVAGLVSSISLDLQQSIAKVGSAIAVYALGAAIGAPILTALLAAWRDKSVLLLTLYVLTFGSIAISLISDILNLYIFRFLIGLAHGVFMAVASSVAMKLVEPARAGRALSLVWIGLTLAIAFGVPIGTFLGGVWSWRIIFIVLGGLGFVSSFGLILLMQRQSLSVKPKKPNVLNNLKAIFHSQLLMAAIIAMLISFATFSFFTFVSPFLLEVSGVNVQLLSLAMLLFGGCSILGNLLGGYVIDKFDSNQCLLIALVGLTLNLLGLYIFSKLVFVTLVLVGGLGVFFFACVTMSTLRLLRLAEHYIPQSTTVAAGLNIASFNLGTAIGGIIGGLFITSVNLLYIPILGVLAGLMAIGVLLIQMKWMPVPPCVTMVVNASSKTG